MHLGTCVFVQNGGKYLPLILGHIMVPLLTFDGSIMPMEASLTGPYEQGSPSELIPRQWCLCAHRHHMHLLPIRT